MPTETEPATHATQTQAIIVGRSYASSQAFLEKVAEKVSPSQLSVANTCVGT